VVARTDVTVPSESAANICSIVMRRTVYRFHEVKALLATGLSDRKVAGRTGIPRSTIQNWRKRATPPSSLRRRGPSASWRPPHPERYCYLLGLYLGDGYLSCSIHASPRLVLTLDERYPAIITEAVDSIRKTAPDVPVCLNRRQGSIAILASNRSWVSAFPQHGTGRKHQRRIELVGWQAQLTRTHPHALLRGLIHSDGSRVVNRFQTKLPSGRVATYAYPRYFFTNYSADIRGIFCDYCELLGIRWTQSNGRNISVSHRDSVAILDSFVGPKN
jgi:hypothetical protein